MATNLINVNPQMQKLANNAVAAAREKFGVNLDFTENSLQQLDTLLEQAHERYKQASSSGNPANIPIENTVQIWGSYLGEVIRRSLGGEWIVDQKNVFIQSGKRRLDPLDQVRSRIIHGALYNIQAFFHELSTGIPMEHVSGTISDKKDPQASSTEKGNKNRSILYIAGILGTLILICLCIVGVWGLSKQGVLSNLGLGNPIYQAPTLGKTFTSTNAQLPTFTNTSTEASTNTSVPPTNTPQLPTNTPQSPTITPQLPIDNPLPSLTWTPLLTPLPPITDTPLFQPMVKQIGPIHDILYDVTYIIQITVNGIEWSESEGYSNPSNGNIFLQVHLAAKNLGPGAVHNISVNDFETLDNNGVIRKYSFSATTKDCSYDYVDLMPNGTAQFCTAFEVPQEGKLEFIYAPYQYETLTSGRYLSFIIRQ